MEIQTHVVVEILRLLPAAVKNVGVNGYVSEHDIHQPNVTNFFLQIVFYKIYFFLIWGTFKEHFFKESFQFRFTTEKKVEKNMEKIKKT